MPDSPIQILLIEDNPTDVLLLREALADVAAAQFVVTHVERLGEAVKRLRVERFDAVLLDLGLPDSQGLETFTRLQGEAPAMPIIVLTVLTGETFGVRAVQAGAQDYLVKGQVDGSGLARAIRYAIERTRAEEAIRQSEERYRTLVEQASDGIFVTDAKGSHVDVNTRGCVMLGYSREEILRMHLTELVAAEDLAAAPLRLDELRAGKAILSERRLKRKDGMLLPVEASVKMLSDGRLQAIVRDITERKQAEEALAAKNEEIRAMTQQLWQTAKLATMGELAASIAHELNNPLATVSLRVEDLLAEIPADAPRRRALEVIEQEAERMGLLVSNLLQFSRRGAQQISTLDVRDEIAKTLELVHYLLRQRRIAVVQDFAPDVPMIQADRQQLRQLFLNLFTNASDAMPDGGTLTIRVGVEAKQVVIEIQDTGLGIAPEDLPKVLEPFFTTKPEGKGTGLGLAICRRIAQEHGGTLGITSEGVPGRGATVRIVLPAKNSSNGNFLKET